MAGILRAVPALLLLGGAALPAGPETLNYSRDIRPLLSNHCFQCHGPGGKPKGGLRLDLRDDALRPLKSGARAIVPGTPAKSELIARIRSLSLAGAGGSSSPSSSWPGPGSSDSLT